MYVQGKGRKAYIGNIYIWEIYYIQMCKVGGGECAVERSVAVMRAAARGRMSRVELLRWHALALAVLH